MKTKSPANKLRILFMNSIQMFGGGEIWMLAAMENLRAKGHQTGLICRPGIKLAEKSAEKNFTTFTIPMRGDFDPVTVWHFYRTIRKFRADVLLANMDKEFRLAGLATRFLSGVVLVPRRGVDYPLKSHLIYRISYRHWADGVIANSLATKKSLLKNAPWLPPEKIRLIYNGIEPQRFRKKSDSLRRRFKISQDEFVFGFAGQLDERKGLHTLLPAFTRLHQTGKEVKLLLAGEGVMQQTIETFIREHKLGEAVHLLGFYENIPEFMANIDALVLPSLWEGFGIVLIEAMAAGKPVIGTRTSNIPEVVPDGKVGWLVPPQDERRLTRAMEKMVAVPETAARMGREGRRWVAEKFTAERMTSQLEDYFYTLTDRKKGKQNRP